MSSGLATLAAAAAPHVARYAPDADEVQRYARDPLAHLEAGHVVVPDLVTLDEIAFQPFEHQVGLLRDWLDFDRLARTGEARWRNVVEEKSRQMGMTWILAWAELWALTYHPVPGLTMSLDLGEVDDGGQGSTTDSFFGKIRFMWERLPDRFRAPLGFRQRPAAIIRNQAHPGAFLLGEGATPNPGRGGRYKRAIADEAARMPFGESAHAALSRACPEGRLYNSTPHGEGGVYFRLVETRPVGYRFRRDHWTAHPVYGSGVHVAGAEPESCELCRGTLAKLPWRPDAPLSHRYAGRVTSPWYEVAIADLTDDQVARELDIDYAGSLEARVFGEFDESLHVRPRIPYSRDLLIDLAFDYGLDVTAVGIFQDHPAELRQIGEVEVEHDATPDKVAAALIETLADLGVPLALLTPEETAQFFAVGDPAGDDRQQATARSLAADYRKLGFSIIAPKRYPVATTIVSLKRLLLGRPKPLYVSGATCPRTIRHFKNNRWPTDREGRRRLGSTKPLDDEHNHMMRALAYYASYRFPAPQVETIVRDATEIERLVETLGDGRVTTARYGQSY